MHERRTSRTDRSRDPHRPSRGEATDDVRLQALLRQDAISEGVRLGVAVVRNCGTVEVRVSGSSAALTLSFDAGEARPGDIRCAVRGAISRFRSSLDSAASR